MYSDYARLSIDLLRWVASSEKKSIILINGHRHPMADVVLARGR